MKPWAEKFYNSQSWKKCREAYKKSVHGLCEKCGEAGEIVHHKIVLTPKNINDPTITLNFKNLRLECRSCHGFSHGNSPTREGFKFDECGNLVYVPPVSENDKGD